ncbi:hypothetical protein OIV83_002711 [Microbotryomycetes sp. JL201]|nr:hypothetical protein OIV83_002711 [Microbotryomycetes sp. JL201]
MGQAESTDGAGQFDDPYNNQSNGSYANSPSGYGPRSGTSSQQQQQQQAFHVLRVADNSPASHAGVDPFFDFVVGVDGHGLGDDIDLLTETLEQNEGRQITLQLYSTKRKEIREVQVVPSRSWSASTGQNKDTGGAQPSLLGLSLRLCNPQHALEQVWHVLEILEGSPAQDAGLVPFGDWIVGYAGGVLRGEGDFYDVVESHIDKPLRLFVYNADYDVTREAILVPNRNWGGEGLLGCGVGYGLLHRIPRPQDRTRIPQDEETDNEESATNSPVPAYGGGRKAPAFQPPPPPPHQASTYSSPPRASVPPPPQSISSLTSPKRTAQPPATSSVTSPQRTAAGGRAIVSPPPPTRRQAALSPPRHQQQQDRDAYEEATYSPQGEYATSHGVSVIPSADDDSFNGDNSVVDFSSFAVPADTYASANTMQVPAGAKGGPRGFMSPMPQTGFNTHPPPPPSSSTMPLSTAHAGPPSRLGNLRSPPRQTA